ncbi:sensor histidine kinase [Paludisphaera mucosa]|uniref:histidine kinase n=1 Tax=Paludisphaera mucosa TaxID=3030827 RepID=A0ABT6FDN1_9BACT|nr:ATP-binding protein [Paludisphaera mucosa]MDG3005470.1 ATP-binding protein [Paludisphaera mucosa]
MHRFAQGIVETVRHPLLVLDRDLQIRKANAAFYRTFGVTRDETEGRLLHELGGGRWGDSCLRALLDAVDRAGEAFQDYEVELEFSHVGVKVVLLDAHRVHDDGTPWVLLAIEDVTARAREELQRLNRELEDRVGERTEQLQAANRELEAFSYSVSHDLRAPLRALDGFSDELLRSYADRLDDRGRHYLRRLRSGTQRMGQLIDDMLQLSRLNRGEMKRERVDLTALAEAVAAELQGREPDRRVALVIEAGLSAVGDGSLLRVALENLLGNAWKFTSKNESAAVTVGREEHQGAPAFFVRDDGAGFDMAHAPKLFGAFQRLHGEKEFPGNGIGLATVQRVVHRHCGQVWAEGRPGRGATFHFTLPLEETP